jgi:acetoin utilization deacetylase AcuC-like enzyme
VLVVDLDVHQGNGTAECLKDDPAVFTFSIHQGNIYPFPKAKSDLDIELPGGTDDRRYMETLRGALPGLLDAEKSRPELVFLQAGCDTLASDPLAGMKMTQDGIVGRDAYVIDECVRRSIPVVMVLGGGYSEGAWQVQHASVRRTVEKYGIAEPTPKPTPTNKPR